MNTVTILTLGSAWIVLTLAVVMLGAFFARRYGAGFLIAIYAGLVVLSTTTATKLLDVGFVVPAGVIVYSASFLITDLLSEVYGKEKAKAAVWSGFLLMLLFFAYSRITIAWPPSTGWEGQDSYEAVLGLSGRLAIAGAVAFLVSQLIDVTLFHHLKIRHGEGRLWLRNNLSTGLSQLVDTILFISIAFYGLFPVGELILGQYLVKLLIALLDTPFVYLGKRILLNGAGLEEADGKARNQRHASGG